MGLKYLGQLRKKTSVDHIRRAWYNGSYTIMAKPIKTLELYYQMIQFLIMVNTSHIFFLTRIYFRRYWIYTAVQSTDPLSADQLRNL